MTYVDGFVIPVPKKNLQAYRRMAAEGCKMWMQHGALDYKECVAEDMQNKWGMSFTSLIKPKPGETIVFSWIVFESRAARDRVNARVMKDPRMAEMPQSMPFDMKRMVYGGFDVIVEASKLAARGRRRTPALRARATRAARAVRKRAAMS